MDKYVKSMKSFLENKNKSEEKGFGCLMVGINPKNWKQYMDIIDKKDIYNEPGYGLETQPHITLLYGFIDEEVNPKEVVDESLKYINKDTKIKIVGISIFENKNEPYDVVKFDIKCEEFNKANKELSKKFPNKNTFPIYHAHATLVYVKKGTGKKYIKKLKNPIIVTGTEIIYSHPDDSHGGTGKNKITKKI